MRGVRGLYRAAMADLDMIRERDPSMLSRTEALLHPAVVAIWGYRATHRLHLRGKRRAARLGSALARVLSGGIEIHPGARIGRGFFIDHGTGVVIGETAVIGDDVTIFHQVTLGSVGWWHDQDRPEGSRRHPAVGDRVVIGANATLLGAITVGSDAVIGAQALVIRDVADGARVLAPTAEAGRPRTRRTQRQQQLRTPTVITKTHRDHATPLTFPTW
ncbi:serine O-acetyltransferase EpsC [Streptomyces sp. NPDC058653]|uniref:serine O-acetyltransferase EpsC n=1 Tax=Streptomyces sp. NPDC058653 TaxID=3346576 RepID=UPI00364E0635